MVSFKRLTARLKRPPRPTDPGTNSSGPTNTANNGVGLSPPISHQNTNIAQQATETRDLWLEAFRKLSRRSQLELEKRGLKGPEPLIDQIEAIQKEAERIRDESLARDWKIQISGDYELRVREITLHLVHWAKKIGDAAIQFSPSPGAGVWAVVKSILQEIDTFDKEKTALLSVVDKVASAIFCGQVYYEIYTPERTGRKDVVDKLHDTLVNLFACVLELLATSTDLSSNTAVQFCRAVFDPIDTKPSAMLSDLQSHERDLAKIADTCEITAYARQEVRLKKYLEEAEGSFKKVRHNVDQVLQRVSEQERRSLLEWISTVQYGRHHDEIEERRRQDTGNWLIENEKFREWMDSPSSSALWLQGSPGTGKTFLTSAVVKHIGTSVGSESQMEGFAYFFCNRDEQNRYEALPVLRSLVRQLAAPKSNTQSVRKSLQEARDKAEDRASKFGLSDCDHQLLESFNLYFTTFIVLDALDEVLDHELDLLMERLDDISHRAQAGTKVKLFVASRPEKEIERMYGSGPTVIIHASNNNADIERFVRMEMDTFAKKYPNSDVNTMKSKIITTILDKCDNMFLWAALQIKQIMKCNSIDSIEYSLQTLPRGLNATYDQIYSKIQDLPLPDKELAERTIKWVMCAPSPLSSETLLGAVRISLEKDQIKLVNCVQPESLLSICENLLILDSEGYWRFFHLSAREYFETAHRLTQHAFSFCAKVCFQSLIRTFSPTRTATISADNSQDSGHFEDPFDPRHPFSRHIQTSWPFYAIQQTESDESVIYLKQFLGSLYESSPFFILWASHIIRHSYVVVIKSLPVSRIRIKDLTPTSTPMFVIAHFSLYQVLREWFDCQTSFDPTQKTKAGDNLLSIAAMVNCVPMCKFLISRGFSVNQGSASKRHGSCLAAAAYSGSLETMRYLVEEAQADANLILKTGWYGSALAAAACKGDLDTVKYLVEEAQANANLLLKTGHYGSALAAAACTGYLDTVKYLVEEAHADVNTVLKTGEFGNALASATCGGKFDIVQYLVEEANADVNLPVSVWESGSTLANAVDAENMPVVQYPVEEGKVDVNLQFRSEQYSTALGVILSKANQSIVQYLISMGARAYEIDDR